MTGTLRDRASRYLAYLGLLAIFAGIMIWLINGRFGLAVEAPLLAGCLLVGLFVLMRPGDVRHALTGRQARYGGNAALVTVAFMTILVLVNFLANRHPVRADLTEEGTYSLSPQTLQILSGLQQPVMITGFYLTNDARRGQLEDLLDEYRFHSDMVDFQFIDPDLKPALTKQYGVATYGTLVLEQGEKRQAVYASDEQGLTAAILKISRDEQKKVYYTVGHKERDLGSGAQDGYSHIRSLLERDNYVVEPLNLSTMTDGVPEDAAALIVAGPRVAFTEEERNLFIDYLYHGGKVLITFDPGDGPDFPYIMSDWGLRIRDDVVVDPTHSFFGDIGSPLVTQYGSHQITKELSGLSSFYIYARSVEVIQPSPPNIQVTPLIITSKDSWGETKTGSGERVQLDEDEDVKGPLVLGAAVDETMYGGRLVAFGDSDFASNAVVQTVTGFANADLFVSAVNWLTEDEDLIALSPKQTVDRRIILTRPQMNLILYSSTLLLPLAILAVGGAIWWANR